MVEVALPGWHWEVEFMADGAVEIERYQSVAGVEDKPTLLEELFTGIESRYRTGARGDSCQSLDTA